MRISGVREGKGRINGLADEHVKSADIGGIGDKLCLKRQQGPLRSTADQRNPRLTMGGSAGLCREHKEVQRHQRVEHIDFLPRAVLRIIDPVEYLRCFRIH